jgi:NAD-dependent dihydropyrimidine dehydrogenase PreA subunit
MRTSALSSSRRRPRSDLAIKWSRNTLGIWLSRKLHTACVDVCPVDCIHPANDRTYDDGRSTLDEAPQLYIDPTECIDSSSAKMAVTGQTGTRAPQSDVARVHRDQQELRDGGRFQPDKYPMLFDRLP